MNDHLSFIDFLNIVGAQTTQEPSGQEAETIEAFRTFDQQQTGKIGRLELK